jgi:survival of motor neuron protein-interacting protein 1
MNSDSNADTPSTQDLSRDGKSNTDHVDFSTIQNTKQSDSAKKNAQSKKRRRNNDEMAGSNDDNDVLNETSTIDDLASIDAATYIAWVNRQSNSLPSVFIAEPEADVKLKSTSQEAPIDGSAATVQVLLSKQMQIFPARTVRHLPPMDSDIGEDCNGDNNKKYNCSQWISTTISNFSELRSHMEKIQSQRMQHNLPQNRNIAVPRMKDRAAWHVFCLGKEEAHGNVGGYFEDSDEEGQEDEEMAEKDEGGSDETPDNTTNEKKSQQAEESKQDASQSQTYNPQLVPPKGYPPTLSLLLQFDQVLTRLLFHHHVHFFCEWKSPLTHNRAAWIYALLARMEKPWHREECSAVRRLLRECCARRWELVLPDSDYKPMAASRPFLAGSNYTFDDDTKGSVSNQDGDGTLWESLALLNTMIAITGIYYEQGSAAGGDGKHSLFSVQKN